MGSRRELIAPRYLAYWIRSSRLMESFNAAGVSEKVFLEALQRLPSSEDKSPKTKVGNLRLSEILANGPNIGENIIVDVKETVPSEQRLSDYFRETLHITTDYIGSDPRILTHRSHEEMLNNVLSSCTLQVVAIFADERGIGAYVTSPTDDVVQGDDKQKSESESESESMTEIGWIDKYIKQPHNVPRYCLYTQGDASRSRPIYQNPKLPHITVRANAPYNAKEIGFAASEFHQLLLNGSKILIQGKSETVEPPGSSSIYFPSVVSVGNFSALLFEHPVRFDSTYAFIYDGTAAPKPAFKKENKNYTSPTGARRPKPTNRRSTF